MSTRGGQDAHPVVHRSVRRAHRAQGCAAVSSRAEWHHAARRHQHVDESRTDDRNCQAHRRHVALHLVIISFLV